MDTIAIPSAAGQGLVVTGDGHRHGLTGKDAAFLNEVATLNAVHQTARDIEVNIEKSGRAGELATEKTAAAIQMQAERNAAASALAAAQNTASILAAQAACCCEIKELVRAEAGATRDLINSIEKDRLTADLLEAKNEVNYLKFKVALPTLPI